MTRLVRALTTLVAILLAALTVWQGLLQPVAASAAPTLATSTYGYDHAHRLGAEDSTTPGRGPPGSSDNAPTETAVDPRAPGTLARPDGGRTSGIFNHACRVAEKSLSALEPGAAKVPSAWGEGIANSKKVGIRWFDPAAA
jgi:hypothetical protein